MGVWNAGITGIGMDSKEPITPEALENVFWLHDSIAPLEDGRYLLEMECTDSRCNLITVSVKFETAKIVRK